MVGGPSFALLRDIQTLFDAGTVGGLSDRQLLERFTQHRDASSDAAFEVLVRRHGPMVLRVCRNVLKDWNDAEDAFQATFIVLARRSGAIRNRDSVESWLFGVACRVAARARVESARRRAVERRGAAEADAALGAPEADEADARELGPLVQEEVRRLPEKYRAPVVLCYWEGLTQEQAAAQLGCPLGTVRSRLARARDLLRRRLNRRGAAPLAGVGAAGFDLSSVVPIPAAVPDPWVAATVKLVSHAGAAAGTASAVAASASISVLVQSVLRSMLMIKVKTIATCLAFIGVGAAGVILAAPQAAGTRRPTPAADPAGQADLRRGPISRGAAEPNVNGKGVQPPIRLMDKYIIEPPDKLLVEVLEALPGRPIAGERMVRPDGKISLGFYGEVYVAGLTPMEVKEKIVLHLRKYLADHVLGLTESDDQQDVEGEIPPSKLRNTDRVFVDVTSTASKNYYIVGEVVIPGRVPIKGNETVLDAITLAGGLSPQADHRKVILYRPQPADGTVQSLPVNIDQILMGNDPTTNYQLRPGDRLVVYRDSNASSDEGEAPGQGERAVSRRDPVDSRRTAARGNEGEDASRSDRETPRPRAEDTERRALRDVERRLGEVERKLDRVLDALDSRRP